MEAKHPLAKAATPAEPQEQQTAPGTSQVTQASNKALCVSYPVLQEGQSSHRWIMETHLPCLPT